MLFVLVQTAACTDSDRSSLLQVSCLLMVDVISSSSPPSCSNTNSTELPLTTCSTIQELKALVLVKISGKRHFAGLHSFFSKSFSSSVCTKKNKHLYTVKAFLFCGTLAYAMWVYHTHHNQRNKCNQDLIPLFEGTEQGIKWCSFPCAWKESFALHLLDVKLAEHPQIPKATYSEVKNPHELHSLVT